MKATKNAGELAGMRACHIRDGAAESEFLAWLEEELQKLYGQSTKSVVSTKSPSSTGTGFGKKTDTTNSNTIASSSSSSSASLLSITEVDLDERVTSSRATLSPNGMFLEPSFPTIAG